MPTRRLAHGRTVARNAHPQLRFSAAPLRHNPAVSVRRATAGPSTCSSCDASGSWFRSRTPPLPTAAQVRGRARRGLAAAAVRAPPAEAGQHAPGGRPGRIRLAGELGAQPRGGDGHRGARGGAARLEQLGEVGRQARVVELPAAEPGVEPAQSPGVGAARVRADRGLGEPARQAGELESAASSPRPPPATGTRAASRRRLWQLAGIVAATITAIIVAALGHVDEGCGRLQYSYLYIKAPRSQDSDHGSSSHGESSFSSASGPSSGSP